MRFARLPIARPAFAHVTCTARGWSQDVARLPALRHPRIAPGTGSVLAVMEFLRLAGHCAQGLSPNNSKILFARACKARTLCANRIIRHFMLADQIAVGEHARKRREAPACMRCRGLTGSEHATDLLIPQRVRAPPDRHLINSPLRDTRSPGLAETLGVASEVACCSGGE